MGMAPKHLKEAARQETDVNRTMALVFVVGFFVLALAPLVFMPFVQEDVSAEKRELAAAPSIVVDGRPNINVLSDTGDYFVDHFAFRGALVDLDATIKQRLFMTSSTKNVVVGNDGWLYYAGTLNDYQRRNEMSEHELRNIVANVGLMQEYVMGRGKGFVFAIAPNKNTLYPQHMPYYEMAVTSPSNLDRVMPMLMERGIQAVDLREAFAARDDVLYYARDSHWNSEGALLVYRLLSSKLLSSSAPYPDQSEGTSGHVGDVDAMLHPQTAQPEDDPHWPLADSFSFSTEGVTSVEADNFTTMGSAPGANGRLVMYRDSFGNNLLPYFASAYQQAKCTKLVPYDMGPSTMAEADDVVVERAERHLDLFATKPPYLPSPQRSIESLGDPRGGATDVHVSKNGPYLVVEGTIDSACASEEDGIFVELTDVDGVPTSFEAFHVSEENDATEDSEGQKDTQNESVTRGDWGYRALVLLDERGPSKYASVRILVGSVGQVHEVAAARLV